MRLPEAREPLDDLDPMYWDPPDDYYMAFAYCEDPAVSVNAVSDGLRALARRLESEAKCKSDT